MKDVVSELTAEKKELLILRDNTVRSKEVEISRLRAGGEGGSGGRQVLVVEERHGDEGLRRLREEHSAKVNELTGMVHSLTMQNHQLQEASLVNKQLA